MNNISSEIISTIIKNKISSVEISDALGKKGVLKKLSPLSPNHFSAGLVKYIPTWSNSNWNLHKEIQDVEEDCIIYVDQIECSERASVGDIISHYLFTYRRIKGLVVNGFVRDSHKLIKENYPIWCLGSTPLGCENKNIIASKSIESIFKKNEEKFSNSILICDDSGCTIIKKSLLNKSTLEKLRLIELQEDIWYYCINTLKWTTYETICLKKYFKEQHLFPENIIKKLKKLRNGFS